MNLASFLALGQFKLKTGYDNEKPKKKKKRQIKNKKTKKTPIMIPAKAVPKYLSHFLWLFHIGERKVGSII